MLKSNMLILWRCSSELAAFLVNKAEVLLAIVYASAAVPVHQLDAFGVQNLAHEFGLDVESGRVSKDGVVEK